MDKSLVGKPVIIGGASDRGIVASCSNEARKFGVHAAMPMHMARYLCPNAVYRNGNMDEYEKESKVVTEILQEKAPVVEKLSLGEHYLDVTGMDKFIGCLKWSNELKQHITNKTGLTLSSGLSINKTVAKVATGEIRPGETKFVSPSEIKPFLDPLYIQKIPGIGTKAYQKLHTMGVQHIHTLTRIHPDQMFRILGQHGTTIWQKANGIDNSPIIPYQDRKSISTETTFDIDTIDVEMISQLLTAMITGLTFQLRKESRLCACMSVKIRYSNYETVNQQLSFHYTSMDHTLIARAKELFKKLYNKRMLIRLVGVKLSKLVNGYEQIDLYDIEHERYDLYQAMDKIRKRFGEKAVTIASTIQIPDKKTHVY
ncbi:MAG: nucleotidyltransferase/DNA polymerase involved in repair [Mucilaginibacter sp.]|nr:nucleotidyltransferase/DNA polymerase involved in repair [Mucilaginibacter sp.]